MKAAKRGQPVELLGDALARFLGGGPNEDVVDPNAPRPRAKKERRKRLSIRAGTNETAGPTLVINDVDVLAELELGVKLADLSHRTGFKRGKLRRAIAAALGGMDAYREKRTTLVKAREEAPAKVLNLDAGVPRVLGARMADGWRLRRILVDYGGKPLKDAPEFDPRISESLFISPEDVEYVLARPNERADLLVAGKDVEEAGLDPIRLRRFETSSIYRLVRKHQALVEQGTKAEEARQERRRVKRKGGMKS